MINLYNFTMLLLALIFSASLLFGQTSTPPSVGDGTSGDPYQIATLDNLYWLSQNTAEWATGKYFIQTAYINATATSGWNSGAGWVPIGNSTIKFKGNYNGQNHTIDGLFIYRPSENSMSLFGRAYGAVFENIGATNVNFTCSQMVAGLVGEIEVSSTINNCYSSGTVTANGNLYAGGLVGYCAGSTISNSHSSCSVTGLGSVGGLIGLNTSSTVSNSYSTGSVNTTGTNSTGRYIGGLVGNNTTSTISKCYVTGSVSGGVGEYIGGLVGYNITSASISNCFATGSVTGSYRRLGGLLGWNDATSSVINSYSTGSVSVDNSQAGGLVGINITGGSITNSFWDTQTSGYATSAGGTGKTTAEMKTQSTFTGATWDFTAGTGIWAMSSTITFGGYPTLQWTNSYATAPSSNQIATLSNLLWVAESSTRWAASYTQTADIVASSTSSWNSGAGWTPIGNATTSFAGSYNGQGHIISGLFINRPSTGYIGLFGSTSSSTIQNLGVTGVNITGQFNVGGLVG
ncbi:MAG: hypothetical protein KKG93_19470, partial [Bacteroidetes bacterium]|nr:hypothetical protein [Bacteroidota bacterium]